MPYSEEDFQRIVDSMRQIVTWTIGRRVFQSAGIVTDHGWDNTRALSCPTLTTEDGQAKLDNLWKAYKEVLLYGTRVVRVFQIPDEVIEPLIREFGKVEEENGGVIKDVYPYFLIGEELVEHGFTLTEITEDHDGNFVAIISCVDRETQKVSLSVQDIKDGAREGHQFEEVYGVEAVLQQYTHVVMIDPDSSILEIRAAFPGSYSKRKTQELMHRLQLWIDKIAVDRADLGTVCKAPVNIFEAVDKIYKEGDSGKVVSMGFSTTTGSIKNERMKPDEQDLRTEAFHFGGEAALKTELDIFQIEVEYQCRLPSNAVSRPRLNLAASVKELSRDEPEIFDFYILNCQGNRDFLLVRDKLYENVDKLNSDE